MPFVASVEPGGSSAPLNSLTRSTKVANVSTDTSFVNDVAALFQCIVAAFALRCFLITSSFARASLTPCSTGNTIVASCITWPALLMTSSMFPGACARSFVNILGIVMPIRAVDTRKALDKKSFTNHDACLYVFGWAQQHRQPKTGRCRPPTIPGDEETTGDDDGTIVSVTRDMILRIRNSHLQNHSSKAVVTRKHKIRKQRHS